ncbi:PREDICTED: death-associated protein 1-like [Priapulus caudatus]|uniref:Death-associated protein 1-like n=1 Tax=Priapulus caudatus TaxID=37621 RepID=A0ABM1ERV8_PRICU|nr:PREDICTED: death-associated protein 1-like [Priapulus caudatus]
MADEAGDAIDLKAGHPPAVKAGGMRITQHKTPQESVKKTEKMSEEDKEEFPEPSPPKAQTVVVAGAMSRGNKDFPPEAVKAMHEKPMPTHDTRPAHQPSKVIQQPRK